MSTPVIDSSPITLPRAGVPRFGHDSDTRPWSRILGYGSHPTRAEVLVHAQREVAKLTHLPRGWDCQAAMPVHPSLANLIVNLIQAITHEDGLATPQFSPLPDGGLSVVWLVNGDKLSVLFEDGDLSIYALWANGEEVFDYDFAESDGPVVGPRRLAAAIEDARVFLSKISQGVEHQLISR